MKNILAFADEFGNNSFNFDKQGSHFIVAAIILPQENLESLESNVEEIRKKYFQKGEIKSSKVGPDHIRRTRILTALLQNEFSIYTVVVDKRKLFGEGFKYKGSFYKFLSGLVYNELFKTFPDLKLVVDEHGSNDFMRGFKKYVQKNHIRDLFSGSEFEFSGSPDSVIIQVADFVAGTLGYCFDEHKKSDSSDSFFELLKSRITSIKYFPPDARHYHVESTAEDKIYNATIAELSVNRAQAFIDSKKVVTQDDLDQMNCVKLLLLYFNTYNSTRYITTKEIIRHLQTGRSDELKEHNFRTKIIARVRDAGVLIASSSSGHKRGYKLPSSIEDVHKFVNHGNSVIIPMLSRIAMTRDNIKLATHNEIDILDKPEFEELRKLIDKKNQ